MKYTPDDWLDGLIAELGIERFNRILKDVELEIAILGMAEDMPRMHKTTKAKARFLLEQLTTHFEWFRSAVERANGGAHG